jgi:hypothetical protein
MIQTTYQIGEMVVLVSGEWQGHAGVVSWPVSPEEFGYVLIHSEGRIAGLRTSYEEIRPTNEVAEGYTQLAHLLLKLSSHLIEKAILPLVQ